MTDILSRQVTACTVTGSKLYVWWFPTQIGTTWYNWPGRVCDIYNSIWFCNYQGFGWLLFCLSSSTCHVCRNEISLKLPLFELNWTTSAEAYEVLKGRRICWMKGRITRLHKALFPGKPRLKSYGKGHHTSCPEYGLESILNIIVLVSAAAGNKSATRPPLPPPACGGEWKEKGRNWWVGIRAV